MRWHENRRPHTSFDYMHLQFKSIDFTLLEASANWELTTKDIVSWEAVLYTLAMKNDRLIMFYPFLGTLLKSLYRKVG